MVVESFVEKCSGCLCDFMSGQHEGILLIEVCTGGDAATDDLGGMCVETRYALEESQIGTASDIGSGSEVLREMKALRVTQQNSVCPVKSPLCEELSKPCPDIADPNADEEHTFSKKVRKGCKQSAGKEQGVAWTFPNWFEQFELISPSHDNCMSMQQSSQQRERLSLLWDRSDTMLLCGIRWIGRNDNTSGAREVSQTLREEQFIAQVLLAECSEENNGRCVLHWRSHLFVRAVGLPCHGVPTPFDPNRCNASPEVGTLFRREYVESIQPFAQRTSLQREEQV